MTTPTPLSPAAQAVLDAVLNETAPLSEQRQQRTDAGAALRAAAAQMIKTDDLTDTVEDVIRGAERHHQAGWLHTIATELEGANG
jgi:hypothetical protein